MSTLIMPSGAFSSDTSIEHPAIFSDFKTSGLYYPSDSHVNSTYKDYSFATGPQRLLANNRYEPRSGSCLQLSESPLSNFSSSEFMTSSHYPASAGQTPPLSSSPIESESSILSYHGDPAMTATLSSYVQQGWVNDLRTYDPRSLEKQSSSVTDVESYAQSPQQSQANSLLTVPEMQMIGSISSNNDRSPKPTNLNSLESDNRRRSNVVLSDHRPDVTSSQLISEAPFVSYSSESYVTSGEIMHHSAVVKNSLLSPIAVKNVPRTSVSSFINVPSTILEHSPLYTQRPESVHLEKSENFTKSSRSSSLTLPPSFYQRDYTSRKLGDVTTSEPRQELAVDAQYQHSFSRNREYRHYSYSEGRRSSNVTPPSPPNLQATYESKDFFGNQAHCSSDAALSIISRSSFPACSETELKPHWVNAGTPSSVVASRQIKKSLSIDAEIPHVKPEFLTQQSQPNTSFTDPLSSPLSQTHARGFVKREDSPMEQKSNFISLLNSPSSSSATYCETEQVSRSPQRSPTDLSVSSPSAHPDYNDYQQQQQVVFDEHLRYLREQQQAAGLSDLLGSYRPTERNQYLSQNIPTSSYTNQLHTPLTAPPLLKQENDSFYGSYNGQMYLTIPPTSSNYHPFRTNYSRAEHHHPYANHHDRATGSASMTSTMRPSSEGLCAVCGDNAACQHYGVRTCEGCKGFFKRTVQKKSTYICLANKNCPVDKRRRNRCQFCRFEKCLAVGMMKEVVRDNHLKGRRGRLPSKPKGPKDPVAPPSPPVSFITSLVRAHVDTNPAISNTDTSKYRTPGMPPCSPLLGAAEESHNFYELLTSCLDVVRHWAEKVPGFCSLSQEDQTNLIESSFMEIFAFRLAYRTEIQEGKLIFCNGLALHRDQLLRSFGEWIDAILSFACSLSELNVDISSFSCMLALILFQDRPGLRDSKKVEEMQGLVIETLKEHVNKSTVTADRPNYFMKLLAILPDLHALANLGSRRLYRHKIESPSVPFPSSLQRTVDLLANTQ